MNDAVTRSWPPPGWVAPREGMVDAGRVRLGALFYDRSDQAHTAGDAADPAAPAPTADPAAADDRPTVLLLHGWADIAWGMDSIAQVLVDRYRVVGLDLRGHGRSERGPYNMLHFIGDLRGVVETLALDRPILVGHSLGGQIAAQFCGLFPEVPAALVLIEGLGPPTHRLAATDPDGLERAWSRRHVERTRQAPRPRSMADLDEAVARVLRAHPLLAPERAAFLTAKNLERAADGSLQWRYDLDSRDWFNGHSPTVAAQRWRGITCPVLVVNGADSHRRYWRHIAEDPDDYPAPLTGADLAERLANFADARYVEIAGAGHMLPYDRPDELNRAILDFLDDLEVPDRPAGATARR